jgi:hypothetical protein
MDVYESVASDNPKREQLPEGALTVAWLKAAGPSFRPSVNNFDQNKFHRISRFTQLNHWLEFKLNFILLADWLESPAFPFKPFTIVRKTASASISRKVGGPGQKCGEKCDGR